MSNVVIHTIGKVATNTLYNTIRKSCPNTDVYWTHGLDLEVYQRFFRQLKDTRSESYVKSMYEQGSRAIFISDLFRSGQVAVCLSCVRLPYHHAMSSVFHHARDLFPELFDDELDIEAKKSIIAKRIESTFFEYVLKGAQPLAGMERLIVGNLTRSFTWWEMEFKAVHGLDVLELPPRVAGIWTRRHNGVLYVILRMEDMRRNLPKVVEIISPGAPVQAVTGNVSEKRPGDWGLVYRWLRDEYVPPQEMIDYYEQHPFTKLFYPEPASATGATTQNDSASTQNRQQQ